MLARIVLHSFSKIELSRKYNLQNVCKYCKLNRRRRDKDLETESSESGSLPLCASYPATPVLV